jgi:phosphate-selective porin OprO/OprP
MIIRSNHLRLGASLLSLTLALAVTTPVQARTMHHRHRSIHAQIVAEAHKLAAVQQASFAQADAAKQAQIDTLQGEVTELATQVKTLQAQAAVPVAPAPPPVTVAQVVAAMPAPAATVAMKNGTATIASSDGDFSLAVHGVFQLDTATYDQNKTAPAAVNGRDLNSGTNFRRARLGVSGKLFKDFDYNILLDFGGAGAEDVGRFHEAWLQYSGFKSAKFRIGEFAPSVGLSDAGSANASPFLERASAAEVARNFAGGDTRMGMALWNASDRLLWSVALTGNTVSQLNTQATAFTAPNFDEQLGMTARLAGTPLRGQDWLIHAGVNYSAIINPADLGPAAAVRYPVQLRDRPELRVDGTRLIDTGALNGQSAQAAGLELGWQYRSVFAQGETFSYKVERLAPAAGVTNPTFGGWYVEGGWSLTGEARKYNTQTAAFDGVTPSHNFNPKTGDWGAFEIVARVSDLDLNYHESASLAADRVLGGDQNITSLGLDWQLNPAIRFVFEGQSVRIDRLNSTGVQIGQKYNAFAVRSQFGF